MASGHHKLGVVADTEGRELDVRRYFLALRRRWPVIAVTTAALVALSLGYSLSQADVYEGEARVIVQPRATDTVFDAQNGPTLDPELTLQTEIQVIKSPPVRAAVRRRLGPVPKVRASRVGQTLMVAIAARSGSPARAAAVANAYARTYIDLRHKQAVDDLLATASQIQAKVNETQQKIGELEAQRAKAPSGQAGAIDARLQALISQEALFGQRLDEVQVQAALRSGGIQLAAAALRPTSPVEPSPIRNGVLALVLGLMLGLGLAAVLEYFDESVLTQDDLESAAAGLPVLGLIPAVHEWRKGGPHPRTLTTTASSAPVAEAYRSLRTSVQLLGVDRPVQAVQVTSPTSGEGKTTTISSLAVMLANLGQRIVLIDADMRRPRLHQLFGTPNNVGLSSVLSGFATIEQAFLPAPGVANLWVVPAGPVPPNPAELLNERRRVEALATLKERFGVILIDSPPVLPVTDATLVAGWVDATLLVVRSGTTSTRQVRAAVDRLRAVDAPLAGTVLNGARLDAAGYGYSYGYPSELPATAEASGRSPRT
ncbi:MAG: tyrosine-protein kinase [Actinomycetota bacterium]|nr:tyrosine-protein kinase [Actinomycetota bacterium]